MAFAMNPYDRTHGFVPVRRQSDRSEVDMKFAIFACAVMFATAFATDTSRAQGTAQSITTSRVDVVQLASGYRASKVIGSTVYNESRARSERSTI
jgi:hypothetical protein